MISRRSIFIWMALASLGFIDASWLAIEHFRGVPPPCSILEGCEVVTTSAYAAVLGVPVALLGAFYYLALLVLALRTLETGEERYLDHAGKLVVLGAAASAWFVYVQLGILKAICIYCMASAGITFTLLLMSFIRSRRTGNGIIKP